MAAPDTLEVFVDREEYSRYEAGRKTITATVVATGTVFVGETVFVELVKARRNRDAVVAHAEITLVGTAPQRHVVSFYLPDLVDQDEIHLTRFGKYFVRATYQATSATASVGSGANGTLLLAASQPGSEGNDYTIEVVVPVGTSAANLSSVGTAFTLSLATVGGVPSTSGNRVSMLSELIQQWTTELVGSYSGDGSDSLTIAEGPFTFTGGTDEVIGESSDFYISIVTVDRLKEDYLFGLPLHSVMIKEPKYQPTMFNGALVIERVSADHPLGFFQLNYNYHLNHTSNAALTAGMGANGTLFLEAVNDLRGEAGNGISFEVVAPAGTSPLSVMYAGDTLVVNLAVTAGVPDVGANRVFLIAEQINALNNFAATFSGTGVDDLAPVGPLLFVGGVSVPIRTLSWHAGPAVTITGPGMYLLKRGSGPDGGGCNGGPLAAFGMGNSRDYVEVRVLSDVLLPTHNVVEEILVERKEINDETLRRFIDNSVNWLEEVALAVRLEPTNVTTDIDPTTIQFTAGVGAGAPIFADSDFDFLVSPLTYFIGKNNREWISIQTPYMSILRVDNLFGGIANTRVIDIDLDWIEFYEVGGLLQLVPFNQEIAFDYIGLIWANSLRGAVAMPNFWHFNMIVGLRECPAILQEVIGKKAAIDALTALGQAFRPGVGSTSLSRDGVSESISYTTQSQYGIYTGTITAYKEFIDAEMQKFRGKYRGPTMVVL